eukprot:scaffold7.g3476.t1
MGNRSSRQQAAQQAAAQQQEQQGQQEQQQQQGYQGYAPSQVYRPQQPQRPYPPAAAPPQPYMTNGQFYGGWQPPLQQPQQQAYHPPQPVPLYAPPPTRRHSGAQQAAATPAQELTQTATIRNAVNLKKPTLEVRPRASDPSKLSICFTFDASTPCRATTFVLAAEDPGAGCKLTPAKQAPAPAVTYDKGLGHRFPPPDAPEAEAAHVVDTALHEAEALTRHGREQGYPLVIRLETVTEKGQREGHSLGELPPGGEQQPWVQSQTTFAQLHREEDGAYTVRVVKQKIWVEGVSYELQEIYGLEQARRPTPRHTCRACLASAAARAAAAGAHGEAEDEEQRLCVICLVNDRDTTVLPCRHMCMCHECAQELRKQTSRCPICRNHVESLLHIKMGYKGPKPKADEPLTNAQLAAAEAANAAGKPATAAAVAGTAAAGAGS